MLKRVQQSIREHHLMSPHQHVLVAVSGGADSTALLCVLLKLAPSLGISLTVAHLNHCIRGKEADNDETFVRKLAGRFKLPFVHGRSDVPRRARRKGISLEMAAREARYAFFARAARKAGAGVVATAHTADDQAETVLLKLTRGAGPRGLSGIDRQVILRGVRVVRPMLDVGRGEVISFLRDNRLAWREDESNRDVCFLRNRVRHEVLPFLESRLNQKVRDALLRTAEIMREEDKWLDKLAESILEESQTSHGAAPPRSQAALDIETLKKSPRAAIRRVLRMWLVSSGVPADLITFDTVDRIETLIRANKGSREINIIGNRTIKKQYRQLSIGPGRTAGTVKNFRASVKVPGETMLTEIGLCIVVSLNRGVVRDKNMRAGVLPARASISCSAVGRKKLFARSRRAGDRMKPLGLNGSKKLQDIFVDEKVPLEQRDSVPLFECGGEIIWLPGYRVARGWEVKDPAAEALQIYVGRI